MIQEVEGDILLTEAKAIAHGIAPNDDFMQGLAKSFRENWPSLYKDFRHWCHNKHPKSGEVWTWMGANGRTIINLMTQEGAYDHGAKPGPAHINYVNKSLKNLRTLVEKEDLPSLAITKLATGVGGLDWNEVKPLIEKHLGDLEIPVYVYSTFVPGVKADEKA